MPFCAADLENAEMVPYVVAETKLWSGTSGWETEAKVQRGKYALKGNQQLAMAPWHTQDTAQHLISASASTDKGPWAQGRWDSQANSDGTSYVDCSNWTSVASKWSWTSTSWK